MATITVEQAKKMTIPELVAAFADKSCDEATLTEGLDRPYVKNPSRAKTLLEQNDRASSHQSFTSLAGTWGQVEAYVASGQIPQVVFDEVYARPHQYVDGGTPSEAKSGTSEGAIRAWDVRGRGRTLTPRQQRFVSQLAAANGDVSKLRTRNGGLWTDGELRSVMRELDDSNIPKTPDEPKT